MGDSSSLEKWQARQKEVREVLMRNFYDAKCHRFVRFQESMGDCAKPSAGWEQAMMLWPAGLLDFSDSRAKVAAMERWKDVEQSFSGKRERGLYEPYELLSLAKIWKNDPGKMAWVKDGLLWEANVPTTSTGHFGEIWMRKGDKVIAGQATPQLWHHALFYLACIEAFGTEKK
jgi:hypothetical protein